MNKRERERDRQKERKRETEREKERGPGVGRMNRALTRLPDSFSCCSLFLSLSLSLALSPSPSPSLPLSLCFSLSLPPSLALSLSLTLSLSLSCSGAPPLVLSRLNLSIDGCRARILNPRSPEEQGEDELEWLVTASIDDSPFNIGGGKRNGVSQKILPLFHSKEKEDRGRNRKKQTREIHHDDLR